MTSSSTNSINLEYKSSTRPGAWFEISTMSRVYEITSDSPLYIGRDTNDDVVLDSDFVSNQHLLIEYNKFGGFFLCKHVKKVINGITINPSTNGLIYNGNKVKGDEDAEFLLQNNDVIRIGEFKVGVKHSRLITIVFHCDTQKIPDISPIKLNPSGNKFVYQSDQTSMYAFIKKDSSTGRYIITEEQTHRAPVYINSKRIENRHIIERQDRVHIGPYKFIYDGHFLIQDDGSSSVSIRAERLFKCEKSSLINNPMKPASSKELPKDLLTDVSLAIPSGKLVALVGGSGAGKSTLLDALSGVRPVKEGIVFYNEDNYYENITNFKTRLGYVPQQDIVHLNLSVEDALYYGFKLRLPPGISEDEIRERINTVLDEMSLPDLRRSDTEEDRKKKREAIRKQSVSKLSGGQRKRVSIALELLSRPDILFLDEPNSGLDPGLDYNLLLKLRMLADQGKTVILVTHATSNIGLCDYVCFLGKGGNLIYFGPPDVALKFFGVDDFVEIYAKVEAMDIKELKGKSANYSDNQKYIDYLQDVCKKHSHQKHNSSMKMTRSNPFWQFLLLCIRYLKLLCNDKGNFVFLLLQAPIIALLLVGFIAFGNEQGGFDPANVVQCPETAQIITQISFPEKPIYSSPKTTSCSELENFFEKNSRGQKYVASHGGVRQALQKYIQPGPGDAPKILFLMAFAAFMFGCVNAAREIVKESDIYHREHGVGVGILPYIFSKIAVLGLFCVLQSLILVGIVGFSDHFYKGLILPGFLEVLITLILTSFTGLMMGLTLSAIVDTSEKATSFVPLLLLPQVIFSGLLFPLQNSFLQLAGTLSSVRWSMAALGSSVGLHTLQDKLVGNDYIYHGMIFSTYSQSDARHHLFLMELMLILIIIALTLLTSFVLKIKYERRVSSQPTIKPQIALNTGSDQRNLTQKPVYTINCTKCGTSVQTNKNFCYHCQNKIGW